MRKIGLLLSKVVVLKEKVITSMDIFIIGKLECLWGIAC